jgi:transketolase
MAGEALDVFISYSRRDEGLKDELVNYHLKLLQREGKNNTWQDRDIEAGVEWATGSLGHGLGATIGILLAARLQNNPVKAVVLLSDGECNEGSVWEAAMFAPTRGLDNLVVVIDFNKWQATGRSREIMALDPLAAKWAAFGWHSEEVDGHDIQALQSAMRNAFARRDGRPSAIVAHTIKGKGISFMEDDNNWHYLTPNDEQLARALDELGLA